MKHLIELLPGDWVEHLSKMNEEVGEINQYQKVTGKIIVVQKIIIITYGNILGAFYKKLPMGIKDTNFGRVLPEETVGRWHV